MKQRISWQTRPTVFSTGNVCTEFSTPIQNLSIQEKSTIWPCQPNTSQESMCSFMHLCKPAHNVNFLPEQWQQIIPRLWEWVKLTIQNLEQCINWVPRINATQPAPTAVHLFHLGHLQLKTGAWTNSTNHMEKSFEETHKVFWCFFTSFVNWEQNQRSWKGNLQLWEERAVYYYYFILNICIKHNSKAGSKWYLKPKGKSCH